MLGDQVILQAAQLVVFSFQDQSHETGHVPIVVGFHSVFHGQCSQFGGCLKVGRTKLGSWSFTFFQHLSMNSNHTTLVIWINPKFGGRFGLSGDGIFWDTWIPRGLRQLEPTCGQFHVLVCWSAVVDKSYDG